MSRRTPERTLGLVTGIALAALTACGHTVAQAPAVANVSDLRALLAVGRAQLKAFSADVRLTYFGAKGRVRGTASLAVERPARLRYELMGPQGAAIAAFATDGKELAAADLAQSRFVYGPASKDNLDQLFAVAPLHLDAEEWVSLLFGEVALPDRATVAWDAGLGRVIATWADGANVVRVEVDPEGHRVTRATVHSGADTLTDIEVRAWDGRGLPAELKLQVPATHDDVELKLRDVTYDPTLDPSVFTLTPPRGAKLEHL